MSDSQDDKKITKVVDKLVMGLIIGGAVGSVLGMAFAPKSGKENRKMVKEKAEEVKGKAEEMGESFMVEHGEDIQAAKKVLKGKSKGVFSLIKKTFGMKKNKKKIPHEMDR